MALRSIISIRPVKCAQASTLADRFADLQFPQYPAYALEAARRVGAECEFVALEANGTLCGFAAVRIKRLPLIGGGLAYIHAGPACRLRGEAFDPHAWEDCLAALVREYSRRKLILRISSPLAGGDDEALAPAYRRLGLREARQGAGRTILLDVRPGLADLRAGLHGKWRNQLNRSGHFDLVVSQTSKPEDFAAAQPLLAQLAARKGFSVPMDFGFYAAAMRRVAEAAPETAPETAPEAANPPFLLHQAHRDGALVACHLGAFMPDRAVYLLGAANAAGREARAAYALQWAVIETAHARGISCYDLGGIDVVANPDVYLFKSRMGGVEADCARWWEFPAGALTNRLIAGAEMARTKIARLRG